MGKKGCPNGLRLFDIDGFVAQTFCDSWNCPVCRKRNATYWAQNVYYGWCLWRPRPMYFLTFTMPGWMKEPTQGYTALPKCWKNLQQTINRKFGHFVYAAFVEEQHENRDMPHLHIITLTSLPSRLNELALHCGFGFQSQNLLMSGNSASYYVAKYASKNLLYAPHKFRRVRISQIWPRLPDPELPNDVLPMLKSETIRQYILRIAGVLDYDVQTLNERWTNYALDIS